LITHWGDPRTMRKEMTEEIRERIKKAGHLHLIS
jgi:hypothetical protein